MDIQLTHFSPGSGCGCKISPKELEVILADTKERMHFDALLVGNESKDDAAVYDLGNGSAVISTTDFFTPIVDDPFDFGRIAATNAINDVFAMGGTPLMAIAILGWPLEKLSSSLAQQVVQGAKAVCEMLHIPLAGGHSIDISDPIFGLAVTGLVSMENIKRNDTAKAGCRIFLTKPLGIGLITTAEKKGLVQPDHKAEAVRWMTTPNSAGAAFAKLPGVAALTDVTGFGLMGHLLEMAEGSKLTAVVNIEHVPMIEGVRYYIEQKCMPGGTFRNFNSYGHKVEPMSESLKALLCDPQTSGGLMVAVEPDSVAEFKKIAAEQGVHPVEIGHFEPESGPFHVVFRD
ncbi:selenide,water dikinase [Microbacter margulisiae]|uniref:Selenide, water dikinase n=2 Tax=Microbacter margulisiae TaxID=1350067 RepID=A0A7W5DNX1_9PORP|nr:selenide, water dikinase SelD [Microbacter margulisiae]MBB3186385.1 selenide,water dikinase [Microbacter margulisiae]